MKKLNRNPWMIVGAVTLMSVSLNAQTTAKEGLEKLKTNYNHSQSNLEDYQKNLKIVDGNLTEVAKARSQAQQQEMEVSKSAESNAASLKTVESREQEITLAIAEETKVMETEKMKLSEIEKVTALLNENIKKRQANLASYQEQMKAVAGEKKEWKDRADKIAKAQAAVKAKSTTLAAQENEWKNKKRGYEGEVGRWQKEVDRQKKLTETYGSLAEVKD